MIPVQDPVATYVHVMLADELVEVGLRLLDVLVRLVVECERQLGRDLQVLSGVRRALGAQIGLARREGREHELVKAQSRCAVQARVLAQEARLAILQDNHWMMGVERQQVTRDYGAHIDACRRTGSCHSRPNKRERSALE